ncbi:hypothetical protein ACFX2I_003159 [Malus domestica]
MQLDALHFALSFKQQGCQHQLHHSGHHASNDEENFNYRRQTTSRSCNSTLYILPQALSGKGKQQGCQHQLRHSGHHAPIDEETSMTAVKRLAGHEACHLTFCLKRHIANPRCSLLHKHYPISGSFVRSWHHALSFQN